MTAGREIRFWLAGTLLAILLLWALSDILLPFVAGIVLALLFDPIVERCQRLGLSRTWATTLVVGVVAIATVAIGLALLPLLIDQIGAFSRDLPGRLAKLSERLMPLIEPLREQFGIEAISVRELQQIVSGRAGEILKWLGGIAAQLLGGGFAFFNALALLFLTPVVAFYLMRDWPAILAKLDGYLPLQHAETIRDLAHQSHRAVAGYLRGQATVCLALGLFYAAGLALVGLEFGLVIGLIAGIIAIIPFVGTLMGGVLAVGMALAQFPPDWMGVAKVVAVFAIGQFLEGNILSPKLVGDSVGLHPVWIMFALLAGGALFGLTGVIIAVPVAGVIGVLVRFAVKRYLASGYFRGESGSPSEP